MRVLVLGATGVLGRNVVPRLLERGHSVRAVVRRREQADALARTGVDALLGDILDPESLLRAAPGCDVALHLATRIPRNGTAEDWALNDRVRREGTRHLVAAAERNGVRRYVQQGITFIYGDHATQIVDEHTPVLQDAGRIQSAVDMEETVRASALDWCILRGGAFYGPGTGREEAWREAAGAGTLRLPGNGDALVSLVHVVDMARAVVLAAEKAPARSLFNGVDDEPVSYRRLLGHIAAQVGAPEPGPGGAPVRSLGCSNTLLKHTLGWSPVFPTYRSGLA